MNYKQLFLWMCVVMWMMCTPSYGESKVSFEKGESSLLILIDKTPVMEYVWQDENVPRPYFKQLRTVNGELVSRSYPPDPVVDAGNDDHSTYHPGAWLAFGDVKGTDFWRNKARVRHVGFVALPKDNGFEVINAYETQKGVKIFEERCRYTVSVEAHGYILHATSTFSSSDGDFAFGDQEEMGFGVRLATGLRVRGGNGSMRNSEGGKNESGTWGKSADWLAGYGTVDGQGVGMMVVAHPDNFRQSWFHSRDYGLIVANPFGKKAMTAPDDASVKNDSTLVKQGEQLTVGFGVYVFSYDAKSEPAFEGMYGEYLKRISEK